MIFRNQRFLSLGLTLLLVAANLAAFNALADRFQGARMDLTQEKLFSVSPATRRILEALDDTVVIRGYFSRKSHPLLVPLVAEIRDYLEEYAAVSRGRVRIEIADPNEDEAILDEANSRFGVESTPFRVASKYESGIVNAFFALVIEYGDQYQRYGVEDLVDVDLRADGEVEVSLQGLEYALTRAIKKVVYGFRSMAELFERVDGPVRLTAIVTPDALPEVFQGVPDALRKAAEQLGKDGGEKFVFEEIDPSGGDEAEARVRREWGARPMNLSLLDSGNPFYLYAVLDVGGKREQIPVAEPDLSAASVREKIENALRRKTPGFLKTVGVASSQMDLPPEMLMQYQMQGREPPQEFQTVKRFLGQEYRVEDVSLADPVASSVDILLVLEPRGLDETQIFHLDQYLMRGGRVILCVTAFEARFEQSGLQIQPVDSGLDDWLAHFGLSVEKTLVLDDQNQPLPVPELRRTALGTIRTLRLEPYPYLVEVSGDGFAEPAISASLDAMGVYWGSPVAVDPAVESGLESRVLLQSSERSWTSADTSAVARVGYRVPEQGLAPQTLAVALSGSFHSFFEGKEPPRPEEPPEEDEDESGPSETSSEIVLQESPETRLVLLGNADFLSDFVANALSTLESGFFQENLSFVQNLIDWVNLDNDMISIRSRGVGVRRLARMEKAEQQTLEWMNYILPVGLIGALGFYRSFRRRQVSPLVIPPALPAAGPGSVGGEA